MTMLSFVVPSRSTFVLNVFISTSLPTLASSGSSYFVAIEEQDFQKISGCGQEPMLLLTIAEAKSSSNPSLKD